MTEEGQNLGEGVGTEGGSSGNGEGGGGDAKWFDALGDDLKGNEVIKGYDSVESLAKAHIETLGSIPKPPAEAKEYGIGNEKLEASMLEAGLTVEAGQKIAGTISEMVQANREALAKQSNEYLTSKYGEKIDDTITLLQQSAKKFIGEKDAEALGAFLSAPEVGSNVIMLKLLEAIHEVAKEDNFISGDGGKNPASMKSFYDNSPALV